MSSMSFFKDDPIPSRPRTADGGQRPALLKRPTLGSRNVTFDSNAGTFPTAKRPNHQRFNSDYSVPESQSSRSKADAQIQRIDRHVQNIDPDLEPIPPFTQKFQNAPFCVYDDSFANLLGQHPAIDNILSDSRGPFFYAGGAHVSRLSTCFLTSNLLQDSDPSAVSSANRRVEITKLEFRDANKVARDKVRCPDRSYMAAGAAVHPSSETPSIILCAQGSLTEAAGLVSIEARRPHKSRMILNNFHGKPFNSPSEIVCNPIDKSVYFTDPPHGYKRGFRPKPKLPTSHIYRFHPTSGDCRVVASDLKRPVGLAFSPDYNTLYVSEQITDDDGIYIFAYDITCSTSLQAPTFEISVVPGLKHAAGANSKPAPASSAQSFTKHYRSQPYATPDSSPQFRPATPVRPSSSLSPLSGPYARNQDTSNHKFLASMTNGLRSPFGDSTGAPASTDTSPLLASAFPHSNRKRGSFLSNKRLIIYTPNPVNNGAISTDPVHGYLWLGTEEGVQVWDPETGELIGKILVEQWNADGTSHHQSKMRGVSKVVFTGDGEALLLGGERIWQLKMGLQGTDNVRETLLVA